MQGWGAIRALPTFAGFVGLALLLGAADVLVRGSEAGSAPGPLGSAQAHGVVNGAGRPIAGVVSDEIAGPHPEVGPAGGSGFRGTGGLGDPGFAGSAPPPQLLELARDAVACAVRGGRLDPPTRLAVVDFTRPSTQERLWVLDEQTGQVLFHELVAHGKNTGALEAQAFSDTPGSLQSSLGLYVTAETYVGKHGYSLRLDGLEPGWNGRARERAIVMHGADYATAEFADAHGRLGRSWGCPAVDPTVARPIIDTIAGGTPLFVYHDDHAWLDGSPLLNCS